MVKGNKYHLNFLKTSMRIVPAGLSLILINNIKQKSKGKDKLSGTL